MRGAAAPRTTRLKRNETLHAYRVAANATDLYLEYCQAERYFACQPPKFGMEEFVALEVVPPWVMPQDLLPRERCPWLCSCAAAEVRPMSV